MKMKKKMKLLCRCDWSDFKNEKNGGSHWVPGAETETEKERKKYMHQKKLDNFVYIFATISSNTPPSS